MKWFSVLVATVCAALVAAAPTERDHQDVARSVNNIQSVARHFEVSSPVNISINDRRGYEYVELELGHYKRNIGDLTGSALYGVIHKCLSELCQKDNKCGRDIKFPVSTVKTSKQYGARISREDVIITVASAWWDNNNAIRNLLIGSIASAAQRMSEDEKNCMWFDGYYYFGHQRTHYCNMGNHIQARAATNEHTYYMDVYFRSTDNWGNYDCIAIQEAVGHDLDRLKPEFSQALGKKDMGRLAHCTYHTKRDLEGLEAPKQAGEPAATRSLSVRGPEPAGPEFFVEIDMNTKSQNIGDLRGPPMYDMIYKALLQLCPLSSKTDNFFHKNCLGHNGQMYVDRWVSAKGRYDPEPFTIRVEDAWHDNDEMRRLFIGSVAGAVQAMSENDKNCKEYEKNGNKRLGCSIANRVRVRAQTDKRAYWLQVTFEAPDIVADFQCESSVRGVDKYFKTLMPEWQGQMWVPVNRKTHCTP